MSIEVGMPEVPRFAMYSGCVLDQLSWQMERSGLLGAKATLVAQGEIIAAAPAAGTPAAIALKRFGHFNGTIKRDGVALGSIVSADVTYANNLDRIETIRSDAKIDGADPTIAALTGKIDVRFADTTRDQLRQWRIGQLRCLGIAAEMRHGLATGMIGHALPPDHRAILRDRGEGIGAQTGHFLQRRIGPHYACQ